MAKLFYQRKTAGDVLYLLIDPEAIPDRVEKKGNVVSLYRDSRLIGVNFLDVSKILKIVADGMLTSIPEPVKAIVAHELHNAGIEEVDLSTPSGYAVATVVSKEEHPLDEKKLIVDLSFQGQKLETSTRYHNFEVGDKLVVVLDGAIRFDGTAFHKGVIRNIPQDCELCSEADLHLGPDFKNAFVVLDKEEGADFFA